MSDKKSSQNDLKQSLLAEPEKETPKPAQKAERTDEDKDRSFSFIMGYGKRECCSIWIGMFFLVGGSMGELAMPFFIGVCVDLLAVGDFETIGTYCLYMLIIIIFSGICVGMRAAIYNILSERIARNLRKDFYENLVSKDIAFFDSKRTGDLVSRLNSDIQVIQDTLGTNFSMFVRGVLQLIIMLGVLLWISPILTGTTMAGVVPLIIFSTFYQRCMRTLQRQIQTEKGKMNTVAEETFSNIRTVRAFSNEDAEIRRFDAGNYVVYQAGRKKAVYSAIYSLLTTCLLYGSMGAVMIVGVKLYIAGKLTIGAMATFLLYLSMFVFTFGMVSYVFGNVAAVVGASDKIVELMDYEPDIKCCGGDIIEGEVDGRIELKDVKFRYPGRPDVQVLKGVSLSVDNQTNRVVALCGTSGCGKSSIISLMERFYDPEEGEILFNGRNIRDLDPKWLHRQIAIVQQEPVLFSGTIRENITYGLELDDKTDVQIESMIDDACHQANAYDFLHDLDLFPDVYETTVGERGIKLSGGQKQRIAIARALIRKPKLLLLDEATSALDAESEHQVQQALDKLISSGQQTVVVVAHRLSTIKDANEIICMQHGEVKERGTHAELVKIDNGVYRNLVERQLVAEEIDAANK